MEILGSLALMLLVVGSSYHEVQGSLPDVIDKCCDIGRQWFTTNRETCTAYTSPIHGIHPTDRAACNGLVQLCCLTHRQEKQCTLGKQNAKVRRNCNDLLHTRPGSEDAMQCCNCCNLGLIANEAGLSCSQLNNRFGSLCEAAFQDCCSSGRRENTDSSSAQVTPAEDAELNICAKFPGQLCAHICINTPGSYECSCHDGFSLQSDRRTCRQDTSQGDRCGQNNPCQHRCDDSGHTIRCSCFDGFNLDSDGRRCTDVNECSSGNHRCTSYQRCVNTDGSYTCEGAAGPTQGSRSCHSGFEWSQPLSMCIDVNECTERRHQSPCSRGQICVNTEGSYSCQEEEDERDQRDDDDDDDDEDVYLPQPTTIATTTEPTGHHLNCGTGFSYNRNSMQCEDINECEAEGCPELSQMCRNTIGSFQCMRMCGTGYQYSSRRRSCEDINECAMNRDTCVEGQTCENTMGSFHCRRTISCGTGYTLDQSSQQCLDDDECHLGTHNCGVARECANIPGSFRCVSKQCPRGHQLDFRTGNCNPVICPRGLHADDIGNCVDIDECVERPEVCRTNQECRNTVGSYVCRNLLTCSSGYELNEGGTRCEDIDECQTGTHECQGALMQCVNRPGSYICQCPEGYQNNHALRVCEDLDECLYSSHVCAQNARCENTYGTYRCVCHDGFVSGEDSRVCEDIDECQRHGMCHQTCRNTWGSFQCLCDEGYRLGTDGRTCDDVDECQQAADAGVQVCHGVCENTHGSFTCVCPSGYQMASDGRTCQDINECAMRTAKCHNADDVCINTRGGYKCETVTCPSGFVKAPIIGNRNSNVKCQRKTFVCPQGDVDCLYAPLSYSTNFITFPTRIRTPADLFTMRGPLSPYRRLVFDLKMIKAEDPSSGETRVNRAFFAVRQMRDNEAVIQLLREVQGPQDVELQLDMNIYSKEFGQNNEEIFFGTAVARIFIYVTKDDW
jgi:fibulin 1/2